MDLYSINTYNSYLSSKINLKVLKSASPLNVSKLMVHLRGIPVNLGRASHVTVKGEERDQLWISRLNSMQLSHHLKT